jgi:hypothetical protein
MCIPDFGERGTLLSVAANRSVGCCSTLRPLSGPGPPSPEGRVYSVEKSLTSKKRSDRLPSGATFSLLVATRGYACACAFSIALSGILRADLALVLGSRIGFSPALLTSSSCIALPVRIKSGWLSFGVAQPEGACMLD